MFVYFTNATGPAAAFLLFITFMELFVGFMFLVRGMIKEVE